MLSIEEVTITVRGVQAIEGVSLEIQDGELVGLVGPKGAGKTSLLDGICGVCRPTAGRIVFDKRDLGRLPAHRIAALGVGRTYQELALFPGLSVHENITLGRQVKLRSGVFAAAMYWGWAQREEAKHRDIVDRTIELLGLTELRRTPVGALPHGLQRRVDLGRALALEPRLLLLDAPTTGLHVDEKEAMVQAIARLNRELGMSVLFASHDIGGGLGICDRVVALDQGSVIAEGTPEVIRQDRGVQRAYLGDALVRLGAGR